MSIKARSYQVEETSNLEVGVGHIRIQLLSQLSSMCRGCTVAHFTAIKLMCAETAFLPMMQSIQCLKAAFLPVNIRCIPKRFLWGCGNGKNISV
jgi:hypothetical protein